MKYDLSYDQDYALWHGSIWEEYLNDKTQPGGYIKYLRDVYHVHYNDSRGSSITGTSESIAWLLLNI